MFHIVVPWKVSEQFAYEIKSKQEHSIPYVFQDMSAFFWF